MKLNELKIGQCARITSVGGEGALRQHFLDMGVIPGAEVTLVKLAPMGDPMELQIHGYELTLRVADAGEITINPIDERTRKHERPDRIYKSIIRDLVKLVNTMLREMGKSFLKEQSLHLHWLVIRIVERQLCLISLPVLTSMSETFRALQLTARAV